MFCAQKNKRGIGLIEIIVSVSIISLALVGIVGAFHFYVRAGLTVTEKIEALSLLEEGFEAARFIRDGSWAVQVVPLSTGISYYLDFNGLQWSVTTTATTTDVFTRTIVFNDVYRRDSDSDIVEVSSGDPKTLDSNTRKVTVSVVWASNTVSATTYLTNIFDN